MTVIDVIRLAPCDKSRPLRVHLGFDLLAHRATEQIGVAQCEARQYLRGLHHLFLIHENPVGLGQDPFEERMRIFDLRTPVLTVTEHRDIVHRTRSIERYERNDVAKSGRLNGRQRPPHPFGFELEHANRVALLQQRIDGLVIPPEIVEIGPVSLARFDEVERALQYRQCLEPEKVELHQPCRFGIFHVELRHGHVRPRIAIERHQPVEGAIPDDDARRVRRRMSWQPLQFHRQIKQAPDICL